MFVCVLNPAWNLMAVGKAVSRSAGCPCDSGQPYPDCCGRLHDGQPAASALELMRARYSAYVLGLETYLLGSWHSSTRPESLPGLTDGATRWLGLQVRRHECPSAETAIVEFVARYRVGGKPAVRLHEISRFVFEDAAWFYVDGEHPAK